MLRDAPAQFFASIRPLNLNEAVDPASPEWAQAASLLQGNIAKSHGRDHSVLIVFGIAPKPESRRKLKDLALRYATPVQVQDEQSARNKAPRQPGAVDPPNQLFGNLYLSVWGYLALGYSPLQLSNAF